jgi:hypothetical protein
MQKKIDAFTNGQKDVMEKNRFKAGTYMTEINQIKDTAREYLDLDFSTVDNPVLALTEKLKTFKTASVNNNEYTAKLSRLEKQIAEISQREQAAQQKVNTLKLTDALSQAMGDFFHAKDYVIKNMIASGEVKIDENGSIVFLDGDDELDLQKVIESLKKKRPDLVKNISTEGSGSAPHRNKQELTKQMTLADFNKLPGKERALKMAEGYKLI